MGPLIAANPASPVLWNSGISLGGGSDFQLAEPANAVSRFLQSRRQAATILAAPASAFPGMRGNAPAAGAGVRERVRNGGQPGRRDGHDGRRGPGVSAKLWKCHREGARGLGGAPTISNAS